MEFNGDANGEYQIMVDVNGLKKDVRSLEIRMDKQDELNETMRKIATAVEVMAENIKHQIEEQKDIKSQVCEQNARINGIEMQPFKQSISTKIAIQVTVIGAIVGSFGALIVAMIQSYLK